jgi:ABC-type antimicrobial peptide transport system permease subunit
VLGIDPKYFINKKSFTFSSLISLADKSNPWEILENNASDNIIYGVADQTVLEWGLKKKTGDTLKFRSESGEQLNIVVAGGFRSSIFQGYLLIGEDNFDRFYPTVTGNSVFLLRDSKGVADSVAQVMSDRFENYGITVQKAPERLATFFRVTNTYLSVFTMLGAFGMLLGVIGLGFVLNRNYTSRKKEFALMIASGFKVSDIKWIILWEQILILIAGIITGFASGLIASSSSVENLREVPWISLAGIMTAVAFTGLISLLVSVKGIHHDSVVTALRTE